MLIHLPSRPFRPLIVLVVAAAWIGPGQSVRAGVGGQESVVVLARRYSDLVRTFVERSPTDAVADLASWPAEDVRRGVQRFIGIIQSLKRLYIALAELELKRRAGANLARYESQRVELIHQLERVYEGLYTGEVRPRDDGPHDRAIARRASADVQKALSTESWQQDLPESILAFIRGAVGLHTALAADRWRSEQPATVAYHVGFAAAYFPNLLVARDPSYGRLWCRAGGTLLTASDHQGAALQLFDRCLTWYPRDPWILLGRGATHESVAMLIAGLPPGATLAGWPEQLRSGPELTQKAIEDYEAALQYAGELSEARIRLARLRLGAGDRKAAALHLTEIGRDTLPRVLAYWAALFLGSLDEATDRPTEAAGNYRTALALFPDAQTPAIAISRVLAESLGLREDAQAMLRERVRASATRSFSRDPWWYYRMGQAWRVSEWLDEIERRSRR